MKRRKPLLFMFFISFLFLLHPVDCIARASAIPNESRGESSFNRNLFEHIRSYFLSTLSRESYSDEYLGKGAGR